MSIEETSQMGLLQFGLICIDFLAWPMLALAYPLCASIRAIETGSKYHMRKLVTYWTILSIVSLCEHTLRVMEWVPLWPYIKLVGTFWLVVPRFNGACYAYDCLVNADLGAKLHCILSQISHALFAHKHLSIDIKAMEQTTEQGTEETKSKDFKSLEQTTEQGTEETKSKDFKSLEQTTEQGTEGTKSLDIRAVEQTTKQGIAEERKVKNASDNIGEMQRQETEPPWVKGVLVANAAEEKIIPEINSSKLIQREWTCAVCQVTTTSEHDLKSHLRGKRHRTNCAELKAIKWVTKHPGSSSLKATLLPNQVKKEPANHAPTEAKSKQKTSGEQVKYQANTSGIKESTVGVSADPKLYCSICNIWCSREADMVSHLKGRKHLSNLEQTGVMIGNEPAKQTPAGGGSKQETIVKPEKATGLPNQPKTEPAKRAPTEGKWKQKTSGEQEKVQANASSVKESTVGVSADPKLYCSICNIWCSREADMASHLKGRKHLSNLKQTGVMIANEPPAGGGSKQGTNGKQEKAPDQKGRRANGNNASVSTDYKLYCSLCNIWAPCEAGLVAHLKGKKHLSNLK